MLSSAPLPAFETLKNPDVLYQPTKEAPGKAARWFFVRKGDPDSLNVLDNWIRLVEDEGWLKEKRDYWFKSRELGNLWYAKWPIRANKFKGREWSPCRLWG